MTTAGMPTTNDSSLDENPIEVRISLDMVKRGLYIAPLVIAVAAMPWGGPGALSAAFALGLVFVNFLLAAALV